MYCPNCGKEIPNNINFCPYCGHKIDIINRNLSKNSPHNINSQQILYNAFKSIKHLSSNLLKNVKQERNKLKQQSNKRSYMNRKYNSTNSITGQFNNYRVVSDIIKYLNNKDSNVVDAYRILKKRLHQVGVVQSILSGITQNSSFIGIPVIDVKKCIKTNSLDDLIDFVKNTSLTLNNMKLTNHFSTTYHNKFTIHDSNVIRVKLLHAHTLYQYLDLDDDAIDHNLDLDHLSDIFHMNPKLNSNEKILNNINTKNYLITTYELSSYNHNENHVNNPILFNYNYYGGYNRDDDFNLDDFNLMAVNKKCLECLLKQYLLNYKFKNDKSYHNKDLLMRAKKIHKSLNKNTNSIKQLKKQMLFVNTLYKRFPKIPMKQNIEYLNDIKNKIYPMFHIVPRPREAYQDSNDLDPIYPNVNPPESNKDFTNGASEEDKDIFPAIIQFINNLDTLKEDSENDLNINADYNKMKLQLSNIKFKLNGYTHTKYDTKNNYRIKLLYIKNHIY